MGTTFAAEVDGYNMTTDKSYKPPAALDAEIQQLKMENGELKNELKALMDEVKQLRTEIERIKREKAKKEKEVELLSSLVEKGKPEMKDDELYEQAYSLVVKTRTASVSLLQRRLRIGYARAARLIDMLEKNGVIGPYQGSTPREEEKPTKEDVLDKIEDRMARIEEKLDKLLQTLNVNSEKS